MNDIDPGLKTILESAVPAGEEGFADWEDILRRAEIPQGSNGQVVSLGRRRRRQVWYAIAAALVVAALLVNPAFGFGDRILDWFRGSSAPEQVKEDLRGWNAPEEVRAFFEGPGVLAEEARGIIALETSIGMAYLWAAPTEAGGWCRYLQYPTTSIVTETGTSTEGAADSYCDAGPAPDDPLKVGASTGDITLLEGRVGPTVASLELRFADGPSELVRFGDSFFLHEVPAGRDAQEIVARDSQGEIIARERIQLPQPPTPEQEAPAPTLVMDRSVIEITTSTGVKARLLVGDKFASGRERCWELSVENGYTGDYCPEPTGQPITQTVDAVKGHEPLLVLLHGFVAPDVASLELQFEDGDTVPLELVEGFFLYELPHTRYSQEGLPPVYVARNAAGQVIGRVEARAQTS